MARNVGPIQVALAGLYGMLGVKDGSNPDIITGFVQPVLDAGPWWLRATEEQLAGTAQVVGTGSVVSVLLATVPQNEWWHVTRCTARAQFDITTLAAGYYAAFFVLEATLPNIYWRSAPWEALLDAAGGPLFQEGPGTSKPISVMQDLWIPPGSRIYIDTMANAANPDVIDVSPIYGTRCRV